MSWVQRASHSVDLRWGQEYLLFLNKNLRRFSTCDLQSSFGRVGRGFLMSALQVIIIHIKIWDVCFKENEMNQYLWWFSLVDDISNNNLDFKWVDPQIDSPKFSLKQEWNNKDWQKFKEEATYNIELTFSQMYTCQMIFANFLFVELYI